MSKNSNKEIVTLLCLFFVALFAEIFLFNFRYFESLVLNSPKLTVNASDFKELDNAKQSSSGLEATDASSFVIKPGIPVNSLKINDSGFGSFTVDVTYTDQGFAKGSVDAGEWMVDPQVPSSCYIRFITSGNCSNIKLSVSSVEGSVVINSVELNRPYFGFCMPRFLLLIIILIFAYILCRRELWKRPYKSGDSRQLVTLCVVYFGAVLLTMFLYHGSSEFLDGFSTYVGNDGDCYRLLTQAFRHGSLSFLQQPPSALKALSNPYDPSARNFNYIFDSAYFRGKYYCYFGITPVITLLLPFNLLTGLYMPTAFACMLYMTAMLFAILYLYYNIIEYWFHDTGFIPFIGGAIACVFGANLFWLIARPLFYELAVISALFYLFLGFALLFAALRGVGRHSVLLFFSGLCFALMVASRPTFIFYLIAAIPLLYLLCVKSKTGRFLNLRRTVSFFAPLSVFALILMAYNYLRFGSPFNFGERYQLTVSNVLYNKISNLAAIPGGIYHYFIQPLTVDLTYPFFHVVSATPATSSGWYYNQPIAGIFNFPLLLILFASVYILKRLSKQMAVEKNFTALLTIAALIITWLDITLAGVLERYTLDIIPVLVFVSLILWLEVLRYFKSKGADIPAAKFFFAVCIVTAIISTLCCSVGENQNQMTSNPSLYESISNALQFWR